MPSYFKKEKTFCFFVTRKKIQENTIHKEKAYTTPKVQSIVDILLCSLSVKKFHIDVKNIIYDQKSLMDLSSLLMREVLGLYILTQKNV